MVGKNNDDNNNNNNDNDNDNDNNKAVVGAGCFTPLFCAGIH